MKKIAILVVLLVLGAVSPAGAQEFFFKKNLANIRVDKISESEILKFKSQFENSNLTEQQAMELLLSRGMSKADVDKMRRRMFSTGGVNGQDVLLLKIAALRDSLRGGSDSAEVLSHRYLKKNVFRDTLIYGSELFANDDPGRENFAPNLRLATPANYIVGPGDKLTVAVYGSQEAVSEVVVSPEGTINLPYGGVISIGGATVEETTARIKRRLSVNGYTSLTSGQSKINVVLAEVRTIRVVVVGARRPGSYFLPAVATVMHALYQSGGPGSMGSYRSIEVVRRGTVVATLDVYELLSTGRASGDVTLQEGDVVRIPTYGARINLTGLVKKPGLYEAMIGESLEKLLQYAGGLSEPAYGGRVLIYQTGAKELKVKDVPFEHWGVYHPMAGDVVMVGSLLKRYANRVFVTGAVMRPGLVAWDSTLTLAGALSRVDGLREDALGRGVVYSRSFAGTSSYRGFSTENVAALTQSLQPSDSIVVGSVLDFHLADSISVNGLVKNPGTMDFASGMTLYDALLLSGGWQPEALLISVEIYSLDRTSQGDLTGKRTIKSYAIDPLLAMAEADVPLLAGDVITVREDRSKRKIGQVELLGEAMIPGSYAMTSANESLSALLARAGGFSSEAEPRFTLLIRPRPEMSIQVNAKNYAKDSANASIQRMTCDSVALDLNDKWAIKNVTLVSGDVLWIPKKSAIVSVSGAVNQPTALISDVPRSAKHFIHSAGGFAENAAHKKVYVLYPNGKARKTTSLLWGLTNIYPQALPGCEVFVPSKEEGSHRRLTTAEWTGMAAALGTLATVTFGILNFLQ